MKAVLFDMDGVLVDSEPVITEACVRALADIGIMASHEDFKPFTGMGEDRFIGGVMEKYGREYDASLKKAAYAIYIDIVDERIGRYPGARQCVERLLEKGCRTAVASAADLIKVEANLRAAGLPRELFGAVLSAEDVANRKPAPDIFLKAAEKLGVPPEDCVVVEDALSGLRAAKAAGARCVCVTTSFDAKTLTDAGADAVCADISEVADAVERLLIQIPAGFNIR